MKYLLVLLFAVQVVCAQSTTTPNEQWSVASKAVQAGRHNDAIAPLAALSKQSWNTPLGEKSTALLVECYLQTKNGKKASALATRFLDSKPLSIYRDRIETAAAMVKIQEGQPFAGVSDLLTVYRYTHNPIAKARAKEALLQTIAASLLTSGELTNLLEQEIKDRDLNAYLRLQLGREYQIEGRWKAARVNYLRVKTENPGTPIGESAGLGISALEGLGNGIPTVLVLAPLSGDYAEFGNRMVQGVVLAHEEFVKANGKKVLLQVFDDRADPVRDVRKVQEIVESDEIIAIIGPMMSPGATAVGAWLGKAHPEITLITPTATDEGIAALGNNIFQLNVSNPSLARSIASYALNCLKARDFAILTPVSDYGRIMSAEFQRAVVAGGGRVLAFQQYQEGNAEYKTEINLMRNSKFALDLKRRNIAKGSDVLDAIAPKERKAYLEDSLITYDAIFIASSDAQDASTMASHIAFNKLGGRLLGSSGWYDRALLADGKRLVEGAYISAPFTDATDDAAYQKFAKAFALRWDNRSPDKERVNALSYDALHIFLDSWKVSGANTSHAMLQQKTFAGVFGNYRFDQYGANVAQHVITVQKSRFVLSDQCPAQ